MVSFKPGLRTLKAAASVLVLAALAAPGAGLSQPELETLAERQRQLIDRIEQEQALNGPRSEGLIGPFTALALLLQDSGDPAAASAAIERVVELIRINYGLHTLEQAPFLQQLIANEEAKGNLAAAWDLEQLLLALARRHPDDLRSVPIFRAVADKRMDILQRFLAGEFPAQIRDCYYDETREERGRCLTWERLDVITSILSGSMQSYGEAIAVLLRNELHSSAELRELEMELVRGIDLIRREGLDRRFHGLISNTGGGLPAVNYDLWRERVEAVTKLAGWGLPYLHEGSELELDELREREERIAAFAYFGGNHYQLGRMGLRRLLTYEIASSSAESRMIDAMVRLADWDLLYSTSGTQNESALEIYEQAYAMAREQGMSQASIDEIFAPETPVMLPTHWPSPLVAEGAVQAERYIDVAFEVTRYGRSRRIAVQGSTAGVTRADENALVRMIQRGRFRPRVADGAFAAVSPAVVRYYLNEPNEPDEPNDSSSNESVSNES